MRIGTMFLGEVEALGEENIQTKFFILGVPLIPLESFYVLRHSVGGVEGLKLKDVHGTSVALGYARIFLFLAAGGLGVYAYVGRGTGAAEWIGAVVCAVLWAYATFVAGKLSDAEKLKRLVLKACSGVGVPPEWLDDAIRENLCAPLIVQYHATAMERATLTDEEKTSAAPKAGDIPAPPPDWQDALKSPESVEVELAPVLYALARYHGDPAGAERIWQAHFAS